MNTCRNCYLFRVLNFPLKNVRTKKKEKSEANLTKFQKVGEFTTLYLSTLSFLRGRLLALTRFIYFLLTHCC